MARSNQTPAERAASAWNLYQSSPLVLLAGSIATLALGGLGVGTEPGRLKRAFGAHILVGLISIFSSLGFYFRARNGFESRQKHRPMRTQTPWKTFAGFATLAFLWAALLSLLVVAWRRQAADRTGLKIRSGPIATAMAVDVLVIVGWLLAIGTLSAALRMARMADRDDTGVR